jgi:NADPH:quinone reductase-like Zn-dependent oxidoreductase
MSLVASGALKVRVSSHPLADAARAYRDLEGRTTTGKLVLTVRP